MTHSPDSLSGKAYQFVHELAGRKRPATIKLIPFNPKYWFRGAWSTVQRQAERLSVEEKDLTAKQIFGWLDGEHPEDFDKSWMDLLARLREIAPSLTLGQAQKVASIVLKYAFCVYHSGQTSGVPGAKMIQRQVQLLPVPIDSIVIAGMRKLVDQDFLARLPGGESIKQSDGSWVRWSRLQDEKAYWRLQHLCRSEAAKRGWSPLEFEMRELWPLK